LETPTNTASSADDKCFDAIYENITKRCILVITSGTVVKTFQYYIWDSTSWAGPYYDTIDAITGYMLRWIKLAAKPGSDEILLGVTNTDDSGIDIGAAVWCSTASIFVSKIQAGTNAAATGDKVQCRPFDVVYEQNSGKGYIFYGNDTSTNRGRLMYRKWENQTWSAETAGPRLSSARLKWIKAVPLKNSNEILIVATDTGTYKSDIGATTANLFAIRWDGSSFSSVFTLETNIGEIPDDSTPNRENFACSYRFDPYAKFDYIAPAAVTDLAGEVLGDGKVNLVWSTAGDDGWDGVLPCGSRFLFVFSTATPTDSELTWPATYSVLVATYGVTSPQKQSFIIQNLPYETTWYFRMRTRDEAGNWSGLSNACTLYVLVLPAAITSLSALPSQWGRCIELSWISPGDDGWYGNIVGGKYRIRYSTYVTDDPNFWETGTWNDPQNKFEIVWDTNTAPLQQQFRRLTGLQPAVTYYIRIWTRDEYPTNWSKISNAATSWAQIVIVGIYVKGYEQLSWSTTYNFDWLQTNISSIAAEGITIENTGNVFEDYGLKMDTISMQNVYNTVWTIDNSTVVKNNVFVLEFLFWDLRPSATHYGSSYNGGTDDVVTDSIVWSSDGGKYHPPGVVGTGRIYKRYPCPCVYLG